MRLRRYSAANPDAAASIPQYARHPACQPSRAAPASGRAGIGHLRDIGAAELRSVRERNAAEPDPADENQTQRQDVEPVRVFFRRVDSLEQLPNAALPSRSSDSPSILPDGSCSNSHIPSAMARRTCCSPPRTGWRGSSHACPDRARTSPAITVCSRPLPAASAHRAATQPSARSLSAGNDASRHARVDGRHRRDRRYAEVYDVRPRARGRAWVTLIAASLDSAQPRSGPARPSRIVRPFARGPWADAIAAPVQAARWPAGRRSSARAPAVG